MSVGLFRLISTVKSVFLFQYWKLFIIPLFVFLAGCDDKAKTQEVPTRSVRTLVVDNPVGGVLIKHTGEIRPHEESQLSFRIDGRILSRPVDVGDKLKAGQTIATLEPRNNENQVRSAQAELAGAVSSERLAALNFRRLQSLIKTGAIAQAQVDEARVNLEVAAARRVSAQSNLKIAQEQLGYTRLVAPADGVVTSVKLNPGQTVSAGQGVVTLSLNQGVDAVFDVPEAILYSNLSDNKVKIALLSDPSVVTEGVIRDVNPQADKQTRTWRVRVSLPNPPEKMALGATVQGSIVIPGQAAFVLPASAMTRDGADPAVLIVQPDTLTLALRKVNVTRYSSEDVFIADGLKPGDKVVIAGVSKLRPGEKVSLEDKF
ncbi:MULTISPECIES: efflux RND transporter periplasmic adaptor subunit [Serratia]|uniref:Efflux RND transporter periplasmic adaptor subunit n=1 Tax=Serratia ureilytica TaxID=300181 RepID=A0ABU0VDF4_9GAMM|nr:MULTISPECIES: efflux RND transporter periplasmic adaptor subunit [Serratia]EMB4121164.1 efflux RND transporter periplasmic adaptor subunit [Serratia marcescens]EMC1046016.1 efflux RND transporter periplasmic adaptor subunit [Serratia marcescens]MBH2557282.1 efflux RND transporter periplasmic adaptor subunit [Serratia ureilytica]MBH2956989.1 efflux RND transporter periplasmic adaptor subunit [Serratia marcescens]MBH3078848.1 efflux RND transporter periplasmic adaptor subunit [Serratia sp. JK